MCVTLCVCVHVHVCESASGVSVPLGTLGLCCISLFSGNYFRKCFILVYIKHSGRIIFVILQMCLSHLFLRNDLRDHCIRTLWGNFIREDLMCVTSETSKGINFVILAFQMVCSSLRFVIIISKYVSSAKHHDHLVQPRWGAWRGEHPWSCPEALQGTLPEPHHEEDVFSTTCVSAASLKETLPALLQRHCLDPLLRLEDFCIFQLPEVWYTMCTSPFFPFLLSLPSRTPHLSSCESYFLR